MLRTTDFNSPNPSAIMGLATAANNFCPGSAIGDFVLSNNYNKSIVFGIGPYADFASPSNTYLERMRLTPTGKLGIGTTNPTSLLHVNGTSNPAISVSTSGSVSAQLAIATAAGAHSLSAISGDAVLKQVSGSSNLIITNNGGSSTSGDILLNTGSATGSFEKTRMFVDRNGKVGIGYLTTSAMPANYLFSTNGNSLVVFLFHFVSKQFDQGCYIQCLMDQLQELFSL